MTGPYRVGNHQPQNVYRGEQYIGVMFTAEDAALAVEALNGERTEPAEPPALLTLEQVAAMLNIGRTSTFALIAAGDLKSVTLGRSRRVRREDLAAYVAGLGEPAESCTCRFLAGLDPACVVHQGRRARGPKPPPLGPGCICDGSGRTCPRHGAVM